MMMKGKVTLVAVLAVLMYATIMGAIGFGVGLLFGNGPLGAAIGVGGYIALVLLYVAFFLFTIWLFS